METLQHVISILNSISSYPFLNLGDIHLTVWMLIHISVLIFLLFYLSEKMKKLVAERLLATWEIDVGVRLAMATILCYIVLAIGFIIILQTAGINLTTLNVLAGAVGIGVGFGLQNIVSNFISGLIILFKRPIKVGDRIEVG